MMNVATCSPSKMNAIVWHAAYMAVGISSLSFVGLSYAQDATQCGSLGNHYGPFDYRNASPGRLSIVENRHFTPEIETLTKRTNPEYQAEDISYTLRVFPTTTELW